MMKNYRSKHEGIKYPCKQCDFSSTQQGNLQKHIQSKHEGIKYPCNQCDYQATQQRHLGFSLRNLRRQTFRWRSPISHSKISRMEHIH